MKVLGCEKKDNELSFTGDCTRALSCIEVSEPIEQTYSAHKSSKNSRYLPRTLSVSMEGMCSTVCE